MVAEVVATISLFGARVNMVINDHHIFNSVLQICAITFQWENYLRSGSILLAAFLSYGVLRDFDGRNPMSSDSWSTTNEFQSMFATAYDIYSMRRQPYTIPWHIYANDFIRIIPSQFLPFEKLAIQANGILSLIGLPRHTGVGFMPIWVISQGIIGLDWIELAIRGVVLGSLGCILHNWYKRNSNRASVTLIYLFACTWSYYTFQGFNIFTIILFNLQSISCALCCQDYIVATEVPEG